MALTLITGPSSEPVTLAEAKAFLRIDSDNFANDFEAVQSIAPGVHAVGTVDGASANVLGYQVVGVLEVGTLPAGASLTVTLQESNNDADWTDAGTFAATSGGEVLEMPYTGSAQYLRAVATIAGDAVPCSVTIAKDAAASPDDTVLTMLIAAARDWIERNTSRVLMPQTWELVLDSWPDGPIDLPLVPVASVTSLKTVSSSGTETTMSQSLYVVDTDSEPGRVALKAGAAWPTDLQAVGGIRVRFVAGYPTRSAVPAELKHALLVLVGHLYEHRGTASSILPADFLRMVWPYRLLRV